MANPRHPGRLAPEMQPDFHLRDAIIRPSAAHKYLGIIFNQELQWQEQVEQATATAAKWTLQFCRLTKPSTGVRSRFMRQLYCTVAMPRFTYAADIWYVPVSHATPGAKATRSAGVMERLESIQRITVTTILGALCTTAMDVMEAHTNLPPVELLMHRVCHRAAIWLAAPPVSHPLHKPVHICACRRAK